MRIKTLLASLILAATSLTAQAQLAPLNNALKDHPAPYLALHGDDPVAWQDWEASVMERARMENKIVLISVGYFACHWCHVMQQESYQDEEVAKLLNRKFISVKIDRELEPALDGRLMDFAQATINRGGWPLNVFVTPEGHPIYAVLYAPKEQFHEILRRLDAFWTKDPERVRNLVAVQRSDSVPRAGSNLDKSAMERLIREAPERMLAMADTFSGGFGSTTKFPSVPRVKFLLEQYAKDKNPELGEFLVATMDAMAFQGINDHLSGGFFRYAVDPQWAIPHFEKMLYDNAGLAGLYIEAAELFGNDDYHRVARNTLDFMQDAMWLDEGLVASFSAVDDNSIEGGHYLWHREELADILSGEEFALVAALWGLDQTPELEAGNQPRFVQTIEELSERSGEPVEKLASMLEQARVKMLEARNKRSLPVDDKLLAGWNALALSAFSRATEVYESDRYRETAAKLATLVGEKLWDGKYMTRALAKGKPSGTAALEDYAYVSTALYEWAEVSGDEQAGKTAEAIARRAWALFYRDNVWFTQDGSLLAPPAGVGIMEDSSTPSGAGLLVETSYRIASDVGDKDWIETIRAVLNRGYTELERAPYWFVSQLQAIEAVVEDM